jgi:hypothetical protein
VRLDVEYRFGREKTDGKPELDSRYSGGVVGSDWWPALEFLLDRPRSSCIWASSCSSRRCCRSSSCISASKRLFCSRSLSYSSFFFSNCVNSKPKPKPFNHEVEELGKLCRVLSIMFRAKIDLASLEFPIETSTREICLPVGLCGTSRNGCQLR